ncbi:MAG: thymidine phosphorylase [Bdellovibrionota bacterium]
MFNPVWVIEKKRDGKELTRAEIHEFIHGLSSGTVADYQATALLMAVYFRGMSFDETVWLTEAMLESGEKYDLSGIIGPKVDKHSTGGVGDKVSLILAPLAAACGLKVPMMSGRGLGHSGGTLDKLESISGFNVNLSRPRFEELVGQVGCAMIGQSEKVAPADRKLYALRDVTGTVECIPLITASILSKKLAEGTGALVLDVKVGSGAFMKTLEKARKLAKTLIQVAKKMGMPCRALLTNMNQPIGYAVGNAVEVKEAVEVLRGIKSNDLGSSDLKELSIQLCAHMLEIGKITRNLTEGRRLAVSKLNDGSAWHAFTAMVKGQGGDIDQVENLAKLPTTPNTSEIKARKRGYITKMDTAELGRILVALGGGRTKANDKIDHSVGIIFHKKLGMRVSAGEPLATVYSRLQLDAEMESRFNLAVEIAGARKPVPKLVFEQY